MQLAPRQRAFGSTLLGPTVVTVAVWAAGCVASTPASSPLGPEPPAPVRSSADLLERLEADASRLDRRAARIEGHVEHELLPVLAILATSPFARQENEQLRVQIAVALQREARSRGLDTALLASVLLVENPWLDLDRRSPVGAVGLMQVMPFHVGKWDCGTDDLEDLDTNICYGVSVFARDLRRSRGNVNRALLRYNGCVRGTNTPDCRSYPTKVHAQAAKVKRLRSAESALDDGTNEPSGVRTAVSPGERAPTQ